MSEEQLTRFEFFVRSHLPRNKVKEILSNAMGPKYSVTDEMAIVVSGLAKLFVGELTEIGIKTCSVVVVQLMLCILSFIMFYIFSC